jgi:transposase
VDDLPIQRVAVRKEHARPLLEQLKAFVDTSLNRVSGKSTLAQAIRYALSRWQALIRYVTDGRLEMSNNTAERAMRPPVLGRENYLFWGSAAGGQRAACMYTIIELAKMCGINPQAMRPSSSSTRYCAGAKDPRCAAQLAEAPKPVIRLFTSHLIRT